MLLIVGLFCVLFPRHILSSSLEHDGSVSIRLLHALNRESEPIFTDRGNITIHSLRVGQAIVDQKPLPEEEKLKIQILARNNDFYRIKAIVVANDGSERSFISTSKACMLAESELDDKLIVSLDYMGRVVGITSVIASKAACEGADVPLEKLKEFTTTVYVRHTEAGAIPDTASFVQKLEREKEAQEKGEVKDNRSFLAKYWMYILPVVVVMVISSATNPEAQGGGGGGGRGGQ
ncbi:ER membrane protein complex subunit 10 [Anthonomus grandis grandis]|uniref:ER membrane protein complex subunit 10 n=1 Tax=Anthonomus grandis grandis TaxID=2921223 RepID=UPI002165D404|nr:ER membrane protein complex subunit 10 [Anthonomus grandis grandis]